MTCALIDDEPLALALLESYVQRIPHLQLLGSFTDPLAASQHLQQQLPDVIFLDISMPAMSGISLLRSLPKPPLVVFTTAHAQFAVEGFNLNAVDYLLKPFPFERFLQAVHKLSATQKPAPMSVAPALPDSFFVKADYQMVRVSVADIRYIEGLDDYIKIYTTAEKPLLTHTSLRAIGERLPASQFVRIHRSYIIALDRIESYTKKTISINGRELPIGESYAEALWERLR